MFDGSTSDKELKPLTEDQVEQVARAYMEECVDFRDSELQGIRQKTDKYYRGSVDLPTPKGRSKVVVTAVRDGVKSVVPSLARIFTQTDNVAEFWSNNEEDQGICKDATQYCNSVFWTYNGYQALIEASTDSLKAKVGVVKVELENKPIVSHLSYDKSKLEGVELEGITEENDEEAVKTVISKRLCWKFTPVPPEEFLIHHSANTIEEAVACAHMREVTISELILMGYSYSQLKDIPSSGGLNTEDKERRKVFREKHEGRSPEIDPTARLIMFSEGYFRIDADGDGIAELRKIGLAGEHYKLLSNEPVNYAPFAPFKAELAPHVFYPICLAEDLIQDQDAQTAMLRAIIDNAAQVNNPRTSFNERAVNAEDMKNGDVGALIRVKEMGQIEEHQTPSSAQFTLPVLQSMQETSERRSGITKLSQGIDPDAMQSVSKMAAQAAISASDARIEMMARNIGETGVKSLFNCILKTAIYNIHEAQSIATPEGFKRVDPSMWHLYINVRPKVGLGSGRIDEKKTVLMSLIPLQKEIIQQYGADNPVSGYIQMRNTIKDLLRLSGIGNYQDYFPFVPPEQIQQMAQQARQASEEAQKKQEAAQKAQQDAMMEYVKVEAAKASMQNEAKLNDMRRMYETDMQRLQLELAKLQSSNKLEESRIILEDDRIRDKQDMDFAIDVAKVDLEDAKVKAVEAKVEAPRETGALQ